MLMYIHFLNYLQELFYSQLKYVCLMNMDFNYRCLSLKEQLPQTCPHSSGFSVAAPMHIYMYKVGSSTASWSSVMIFIF